MDDSHDEGTGNVYGYVVVYVEDASRKIVHGLGRVAIPAGMKPRIDAFQSPEDDDECGGFSVVFEPIPAVTSQTTGR